MPKPRSERTLAARELINSYSSQSKLPSDKSLGKHLFDQRPDLFEDAEQGRDAIRSAQNKHHHTKPTRDKRKVKSKDSYIGLVPACNIDDNDYAPFKIQGPAGIVIANDPHIGAHDEVAMASMLNWMTAMKREITHVVWSDFWDAFVFSRYFIDPMRHQSRDYETDIGWKIWELADKAAGGCEQVLNEGNHDIRLEKLLQRQAPYLAGHIEDIRDAVYRYREHGIKYLDSKRRLFLGKLLCIHGHEYRFSTRTNPAYGLQQKVKMSAICGHFHRASEHSSTNGIGEMVTTWSTGCLCRLNQPYIQIGAHDWVHGFAFVKVEADGSFHVDNFRIDKGRIY